MTLTGSAFTFNKKLWSIFLMNATLSAKLLLIAGIAIHTTTANAQPSDNNNNNTDSSEVSAMKESVNQQNETTEQAIKPASDVLTDIENNVEPLAEKVEELDSMMTELSDAEQNPSSFNVSSETTSTSYNFERPPLGSGDIFIPVVADARVFAEFIDKLPAVVNYYTRFSELAVIEFYSESFGEPVSQERKRERLTVTYLLGDISTRVVISEQNEQQQVDVIQESF